VTPDRGLYTSIIGGFIVSAFGGSRFRSAVRRAPSSCWMDNWKPTRLSPTRARQRNVTGASRDRPISAMEQSQIQAAQPNASI
jgi:hypothetical protein